MNGERIDHRFVDRDGAPVYDLPDYPNPPLRVTGTVVEYERLEGHIVFTHTVEVTP